jgi:hypothetical protein
MANIIIYKKRKNENEFEFEIQMKKSVGILKEKELLLFWDTCQLKKAKGQ